jgi:acyl-CoA dehydrogenase
MVSVLAEPAVTRPQPATLARQLAPSVAEGARDVDGSATFPVGDLSRLRESGLMGLLVPREYGGLGGTYADLAAAARVLGEASASTAMIWSMHCQQVAAIVDHADEELRAAVLPRIAAGEIYLASVTSEKGKGGHLLTAMAPLHTDGGELMLEREAPIVTGGEQADAFLTTMRAGPDASPSDVVLVYAERDELELTTTSRWDPLGMRGTHSVAMTLSGRLPSGRIIGRRGFGDVAIRSFIPAGHIAWAASWLGAAAGPYQQMIELWRDPKGRSEFDLASPLFAERLARIRLDLDTVGAYLHRVVDEYQELRADELGIAVRAAEPWFQLHLNGLKVLAAERLFEATDRLVQLAGMRHGYLKTAQIPLERAFRDLRSGSLNYADDRLYVTNGRLALLDRALRLP